MGRVICRAIRVHVCSCTCRKNECGRAKDVGLDLNSTLGRRNCRGGVSFCILTDESGSHGYVYGGRWQSSQQETGDMTSTGLQVNIRYLENKGMVQSGWVDTAWDATSRKAPKLQHLIPPEAGNISTGMCLQDQVLTCSPRKQDPASRRYLCLQQQPRLQSDRSRQSGSRMCP